MSEMENFRVADKCLTRPGRKQATATEVLSFIYPIYKTNWRNIRAIFIYNKTSINRNIPNIRKNISVIGKQFGLRTYQHPCTYNLLLATGSLLEFGFSLEIIFI